MLIKVLKSPVLRPLPKDRKTERSGKTVMEREEIITYKNLLKIKEGKSMESMVPVSTFKIRTLPWTNDMQIYTGEEIFVREQVADMLDLVNRNVRLKMFIEVKRLRKVKKLELVVTYGYRHPKLQEKYFIEQLENKKVLSVKQSNELSDVEQYSIVHNLIAVPNVAGHPTGGAVDVTLYADGVELDMGTKIADFSNPKLIPTFSPLITPEQLENRLVLRKYMMGQGFIPFNGEWWHFSYGDKEWAYWTHQKKSIYQQIEFTFKNVNV